MIKEEQMNLEVAILEKRLLEVKSLEEKLSIKDEILQLKMKNEGVKQPTNFDIECVGCGS